MIASLPMYDLAPLRDATDAWWQALAAALRRQGLAGVPEALDRGDRYAHWAAGDLLLSQSCGYPLVFAFADRLQPLAAPFYDAPWCRGPDYCSLVMVREGAPAVGIEGLRGARVAVNGFDSHSGCNALRAAVAPLARDGRFFAETIESGSHLASLAMVAAGEADACAIDGVLHALLADAMPEALAGLRVLAATAYAPNLPYVTAAGRGADEVVAMRLALLEAASDPALAGIRRRLRIAGFTLLAPEAWRPIAAMEREAAALGYPRLA